MGDRVDKERGDARLVYDDDRGAGPGVGEVFGITVVEPVGVPEGHPESFGGRVCPVTKSPVRRPTRRTWDEETYTSWGKGRRFDRRRAMRRVRIALSAPLT